jgi:hypothetical protein
MIFTRISIEFANDYNHKSGLSLMVDLFSKDRGTPESSHPPRSQHEIFPG